MTNKLSIIIIEIKIFVIKKSPLNIFVQKLNLRKNSIERGLYESPPFPLTLKVYIFDILNKDEVQNGAKPHFKEIGPYYFE